MFLATTAIHEFWDKSQKILFLGEWCKLYNQKYIWSKLDFEVLPYHWNDRKKLYSDVLFLNGVYEEYLNLVSCRLNEIHRLNHSLKYWRVILGPWLSYFIEIVYDRYLSIINAAELNYNLNTWILPNQNYWIPNNFPRFLDFLVSDQYNLYLYSRIIELLNIFPYEYRNVVLNPVPNKREQKKIKSILYTFAKNLLVNI